MCSMPQLARAGPGLFPWHCPAGRNNVPGSTEDVQPHGGPPDPCAAGNRPVSQTSPLRPGGRVSELPSAGRPWSWVFHPGLCLWAFVHPFPALARELVSGREEVMRNATTKRSFPGILGFEGAGVCLVYEVPGCWRASLSASVPDGDVQPLLSDGLSLSIPRASSQG